MLLPSESSESIERKIEAARVGDAAALGQVLDVCRNYLLLTANRELEPEFQAKVAPSDVVQKTFLEACRDFGQFRGGTEAEFLAWLRGILLHNVANVRRDFRGAAKRRLAREQPLFPDAGQLAFDAHTPGSALAAQEQRELVVRALDQLPEHYREVLLLRQEENCSFPEIGKRLGRTAESARKLWARAVEQLKEILKSQSITR
ncbi:MAG: sigma-70 family RNA polymerase sigma factor [Planctomycetia bacterium]|nr:sigma-70 family RNA polymerase sigma factor [Planctomycetia bacterium]